MRIQTGTRLITLTYLVLALGLGLSLVAFSQARSDKLELLALQLQAKDQVALLKGGIEQLSRSARSSVITGEDGFEQAYLRELEVNRSVDKAARRLRGLSLSLQEEQLLRQVQSRAAALIALQRRAMALARAGQADQGRELLFSVGYDQQLRQVLEPGDRLMQRLQGRLDDKVEAVVDRAQLAWRQSVVLIGLAMLFALVLLLVVVPRSVVQPLLLLERRMLQQGVTEQPSLRLPACSAQEIHDLAHALGAYERAAQQLAFDQWAKTQQVRIGQLLQQAGSSEELARIWLSELAALLEIGAASFYAWVGGEQPLRLIGSYAALDRPVRLHIGEGLVGQCARDRTPLVLTDPPPDYRIRSGLGDAVPAMLLVLPIIGEPRLLAVVELASFTPLEPRQRSLITDMLPLLAALLARFSQLDALQPAMP
ncbi:GAF domain-containing protein [Synechococcus sp. CS-1328]|uniref:GAF domain-containing protein n=1 Tax=Synechococcus sp. CS-1328 TaxID=2847976 RepID=UPI00223BA5D7|nr:GAF domain-containing protein [Synechococcus sp. CS-1328]MCT0223665.1 GAF domain-containing protein [Synechococcus sp. CS-1328]